MKAYYFVFMALITIISHCFAQEVNEQNIPASEESTIVPEGGPESELIDLSSEQQTDEGTEEQEDLFDQEMEDDTEINNEVMTEEMQ